MVAFLCLWPMVHGTFALGQPATRESKLTQFQLQRLNEALAPLHDRYDPAERMLKDRFSSPGYHTTLTGGFIHSTRSSLNYAVACLDAGDELLRQRAEQILDRVIRLQDQNPGSKTYGIWSWFLEEPLDKMSPPDWNWADFCGTALLQVALDHRSRITPELMKRIDASIQHAAKSIRKRNVGPGYTNIAIMGTYVTLVAAELYDLSDLREYALARWQRFYEHTLLHGAFTEYNSPTYTVVALKELARMLQHVRDPQMLRATTEIYELAWQEIAEHFHPPTRQWAGPHSRCYRTLLGRDTLALITRATGGEVNLGSDTPSIDEVRVSVRCPRKFQAQFQKLTQPRELRKTFIKGDRPIVGTTYLAPEFTLGTINYGDFWNQKRPLLAYAGSYDRPSYFRVRFLHDDYDFTAAQFVAAQRQGAALAGVAFAVDGGDRHPSLDRIKNGTIRAKDLRLRFELGGAAGRMKPTAPGSLAEGAALALDDVNVALSVLYAKWGEVNPRWQAGQNEDTSWLDVVLYSGEETEFKLTELADAAMAFAISISADGPAEIKNATAQLQAGRVKAAWNALQISLPSRPMPMKQVR